MVYSLRLSSSLNSVAGLPHPKGGSTQMLPVIAVVRPAKSSNTFSISGDLLLGVAITLRPPALSLGYFCTSISTSYFALFLSLLLMVTGAGTFKPIISGTIARTTDQSNSALGFGVYYWSINLGAFLFPLFLIPFLKGIGWSYIFLMASIFTGSMLLLNLFIYKEPQRTTTPKSIIEVFKGMVLVLKDYRFFLMILIYSGFWIMYFQMKPTGDAIPLRFGSKKTFQT